MTKGRYEVVGRLPPEHGGKTSLALMGPGRKLVVLRPIGAAQVLEVPSPHPQLPAPLGVEPVEGAPCAVFEFFPGATLHEIVDVYRAQEQLPPLGLAVRVVVDAARILHVAHGHPAPAGGLVHGGISDGSLLLGFDGEVRVLDFGLRKATRFTSPEGSVGGALTAKSDVFSLAAALHTALTGFDRSYAQVLAKAPSSAQFPPPSQVHPDATTELDSLLMRAMFPDPSSRLASAAELADDLERIVGASLPAREACATRLKQLFEERLDGLRTLIPRPPPEPPPKPRVSKTSLPSMPAAEAPPPAPRKSGSRQAIPKGTQPDTANPIGRRPTPPEVKAAFGDDDGLEDERTVVADQDPRLVNTARPTGEQKKLEPPAAPPTRPSGSKKAVKKPPAPLPDVPWEEGPLRAEIPTSEREAPGVPAGGALAIEDVPTGLSRRASGSHPAAKGGSSREEKARAVGQELVDTGEVEPVEAFDDPDLDDLRDQPTVVRVSGTHQKLKVDTSSPDFAAAFGDGDAGDEPGTAIITSKEGPKARAAAAPPPPELPEEPGTGPALESPLEVPDTGVLEHNKAKAAPPEDAAPPKKKAKPARVVLASMLVVLVGGFGFMTVKNPTLVKAKLDAALVKWGFKKAPPPPEDPADVALAEGPDGGAAEPVPVAAPLLDADGGALADDDADGGEEEEDDEDGGVVTASDGGKQSDGGAVPHKVKKKKKKKRRGSKEWWQTQQ